LQYTGCIIHRKNHRFNRRPLFGVKAHLNTFYQKFGRRNRFIYKVNSSEPHAFNYAVFILTRGKKHNRNIGITSVGLYFLKSFKAVNVRHIYIQQYKVELYSFHKLEHFLKRLRRINLIIFFEVLLQRNQGIVNIIKVNYFFQRYLFFFGSLRSCVVFRFCVVFLHCLIL
jgi:hypothetical protein